MLRAGKFALTTNTCGTIVRKITGTKSLCANGIFLNTSGLIECVAE
mgnify:CR=1 FL=1